MLYYTLDRSNDGYVYLASSYSHPDPVVMSERHQLSCRVAGELFKLGVILFAPIAQSEAIVMHGDIQGTAWETWKRFDSAFVLGSKAVYVIDMDGWKESIGVSAEIQIAFDSNITCLLLNPDTLNLTGIELNYKEVK